MISWGSRYKQNGAWHGVTTLCSNVLQWDENRRKITFPQGELEVRFQVSVNSSMLANIGLKGENVHCCTVCCSWTLFSVFVVVKLRKYRYNRPDFSLKISVMCWYSRDGAGESMSSLWGLRSVNPSHYRMICSTACFQWELQQVSLKYLKPLF